MSETPAHLEARANSIAREHMGEFAWPTVIYGLTVSGGYFATLALVATGHISTLTSFLLIVLFTYANYTVVHDAAHKSINGKNRRLLWLNETMGHLCALPLWMSFLAHRREHFTHHQNTNIPDKDPDLPMAANGFFTMVTLILKSPTQKVEFYFKNYAAIADRKEKATVLLAVGFGFAWRITFAVLFGWKLALLLFIGAGATGALILQGAFAWIVHRSFDRTGRYHDTSIIMFPKGFDTIITYIWLFQNYHAVHHLFPRVPFYRYRQLFRKIEDIMIAKNAPIYRVGKTPKPLKLPSLTH